MTFYAWCARCIPGFTILLILALELLSLTDATFPFAWSFKSNPEQSAPIRHDFNQIPGELTWSQTIFAAYNIFIHVLSLLFPLRLCWSLWQVAGQVQDLDSQHVTASVNDRQDTKSLSDGSLTAPSSPIDSSPAQRYADDGDTGSDGMGMIFHAILLPIYKENLDTLRATLDVLASHAQAESTYDIWLAMEEKDPDAKSTADALHAAYAKKFRNIRSTLHPSGLANEVQGKSSNISWAGRAAAKVYLDPASRKNCIMTVIDADTQLSYKYFAQLTKLHFNNAETAMSTLYSAPIVFDRNAHTVPTLVRLADITWSGAGLSGLYPNSPIIIPTSVYSLPLSLVEMVGGWDTNAQAIGEDLHMFLKCYFRASGDLVTRTIYSPVSQSNVASSGRGIRGWVDNLKARYRQAMRHMWGALDTGFACEQACLLTWRLITRKRCGRPSLYSMAMLSYRLFEAHFLTVHLFLLLVATEIYKLATPTELIPPLLLRSILIADKLRGAAFVCMLCAFFLYESYHAVCVRSGEDELHRAGLYQHLRGDSGARRKRGVVHWAQYLLFPISGIIFVTVPSIVAQLSHFLTDKLDYEVSMKPSALASGLYELVDVEKSGVDDAGRGDGHLSRARSREPPQKGRGSPNGHLPKSA